MAVRHLLALAALICGAAAPAPEPQAAGFDFRGAALGMRLADFRRLAFPDPTAETVRIVCTGDMPEPFSEERNRIEEAVGAFPVFEIDCSWVRTETQDGVETLQIHPVPAQGFPQTSQIYRFGSLERDGEPVLFNIEMSMGQEAREAALRDLTLRYGSPEVHLLKGRNRDREGYYIWRRGDQTLRLRAMLGKVDLDYELETVARAVLARRGP